MYKDYAEKNTSFRVMALEKTFQNSQILSLSQVLEMVKHPIPLDGQLVKLKKLYFGHWARSHNTLEKIIMLVMTGRQRMRGTQELKDDTKMGLMELYRLAPAPMMIFIGVGPSGNKYIKRNKHLHHCLLSSLKQFSQYVLAQQHMSNVLLCFFGSSC